MTLVKLHLPFSIFLFAWSLSSLASIGEGCPPSQGLSPFEHDLSSCPHIEGTYICEPSAAKLTVVRVQNQYQFSYDGGEPITIIADGVSRPYPFRDDVNYKTARCKEGVLTAMNTSHSWTEVNCVTAMSDKEDTMRSSSYFAMGVSYFFGGDGQLHRAILTRTSTYNLWKVQSKRVRLDGPTKLEIVAHKLTFGLIGTSHQEAFERESKRQGELERLKSYSDPDQSDENYPCRPVK